MQCGGMYCENEENKSSLCYFIQFTYMSQFILLDFIYKQVSLSEYDHEISEEMS